MTTSLEKKSSVELPEHVFDVPANIPLMHQVVTAQLAAARQGTHSTKTRGDVRGGGKKPYRQKGTGRARQGSTRAPQFTGGGVVHGPQPRDYSQKTPKKMKAAALRGALSDRARHGLVHVVPGLVDGETPSTKKARTALVDLVGADVRALVVLGREDVVSWLSLRNLPTVHLIEPGQLNTYDVLVNDVVVFTEDALNDFLEGPIGTPGKRSAKASAREGEVVEGTETKYGSQSHAPLADGSQPEGFPVKGNEDSMLYHVPGSSFYARTVAEVWFTDAEAAEAAGFSLPPSQRAEKKAADQITEEEE
ncbi:50S ribosomal protein L4 sunset domain variant [Pseudonocardia lacus]|uniref:50S ribosomal protein L4, sunset domain variant n=1 Tax=Pseudonocardia lacus TaxID=2835865 RepID=UPI001BDBC23D